MEFIKDKSGKIVLAFDGDNLYFHSQEPDEDSDFDESISIEQLKVENNGGLKLFTILYLQEELDIISEAERHPLRELHKSNVLLESFKKR